MSTPVSVLCGVELGGTKCVCLVGSGPENILAQASLPTGADPAVTMGRIATVLKDWRSAHGPIAALGISSFGPLDLAARSATYGCITSTPKPGWRRTDVVGPLSRACPVPVGFDTDVNGAALAEGRWGAASRIRSWAISASCAVPVTPSRAPAAFTATASRAWLPELRSSAARAGAPRTCSPMTQSGTSSPMRSGNCCTRSCWRQRRSAVCWAAG